MKTKKQIEKINETKSCFFEKINKTDKPLARLTKKKRGVSNKVRNERDITTDTVEIQRSIEYYEQLYNNKFDNLEKNG